MELNFEEIFNSKIGEIRQDEYAKDGKPYCCICNAPRFAVVGEGDEKHYVRALCKCQQERIAKREEAERVERSRQKFLYNQRLSMIGEKYLNATFSRAKITPRNEKVFNSVKTYVEHANECLRGNLGLYIYGENSTGKTYLTACMCNALIEKGFSCIYTSIPFLLAQIQSSFNGDSNLGLAKVVNMLSDKDFVFIDDLGKEFIGRQGGMNSGKFAERVLLEVLNARYNNGLPVIFSSNYSLEEFATKFGLDPAIIERVNEMSTRVLKLTGDNFRNEELKRKTAIAERLGI